MDLKIKICTDNSCKLIVRDDTGVGGTGYLPESSTSTVKGRFKYSDTVSIDVIKHNLSEGPKIYAPVITTHESEIEPVVLPIGFDGWFEIYHILLPSEQWFTTELEKPTGSALSLYDIVYYSDGNIFYKYVNGNISVVAIDELVEINIEGTTVSRIYKDYISICFLKKCYISLCEQIFNSRGFNACWNKNDIQSELEFKRDLVLMAINVIKFRTEFNQLAEAQRIIEQIGGCNGLCKSEYKRIPDSGCGCRK